MTDAFTAKEIALLANTTPKRLRSFIRALAEKGSPLVDPVGSGARYAFTSDEAKALIAAFAVRHITSGEPATRSIDELKALLDDEVLPDEDIDEEDIDLLN